MINNALERLRRNYQLGKRYQERYNSIIYTARVIIYGAYWLNHKQGLPLLMNAKTCIKERLGFATVNLVSELSDETLGVDPELARKATQIGCHNRGKELGLNEKETCGRYFLERSINSFKIADIMVFFLPHEPLRKAPQGTVIEITYLAANPPREDKLPALVLIDPRGIEPPTTSLLPGILEKLQERGAIIAYDLSETYYSSKQELCNLLENYLNQLIDRIIREE